VAKSGKPIIRFPAGRRFIIQELRDFTPEGGATSLELFLVLGEPDDEGIGRRAKEVGDASAESSRGGILVLLQPRFVDANGQDAELAFPRSRGRPCHTGFSLLRQEWTLVTTPLASTI
jgi:hypothetical protein